MLNVTDMWLLRSWGKDKKEWVMPSMIPKLDPVEFFGRIKFSTLLRLVERSGLYGLPIARSMYLLDCDIIYWKAHLSGMWEAHVRVGELVEKYLKSTKEPSVKGWCFYRAKHRYGLDRPRVSMG